MSVVNVTNVAVGNNPAPLSANFEFEVCFECLEALQEDLEWKLTYVGRAEDKSKDQELDCIALGPIQRGSLKFVFSADPPDFNQIEQEDIHGITVVLLTGLYREQEFIRVGWYVHNVYPDPELQSNPPDAPQLDQMQRIILTDAPRLTRFNIDWDRPREGLCDPLLVPPADIRTDMLASASTAPVDGGSGVGVALGMGGGRGRDDGMTDGGSCPAPPPVLGSGVPGPPSTDMTD